MTEDELFEAAWQARQALKSPDHAADVEKAEKLSIELEAIQSRVIEREQEAMVATGRLRAFHRGQVESGEAEPAENQQARSAFSRYFNGNHPTLSESEEDEGLSLDDLAQTYAPDSEYASPRANGAYSED